MSLFNINSDEPHPSNTTTIIAVKYDDGIILGSTSTITQLNANVLSCHCVHETEILLEDVRNFIINQENTMVTAEMIETMLSMFNTLTELKNMLQTGVITDGAKKIYEINNGGIVMEKSNFCVGGYGVAYLNNFLKKEWRKGMNEEEADNLVLKTLSLGISFGACDLSIGIQTASVNSKGITRAFHPRDTIPSTQELDLEHAIGDKALLECVRAHLISWCQCQGNKRLKRKLLEW